MSGGPASGPLSMTLDALLPDPGQLGSVRRFVRRALADAPEVDADVTVLLANELATNAVLHGRTEFGVEVRVDAAAVWVGVHDANPRLPTALGDIEDATNGHGLKLVDRWASRWGTHLQPGGKVVWFEMGRPPR
ncbi:MAG: ATP-binding protein [Acidimicrobiales bacterium]